MEPLQKKNTIDAKKILDRVYGKCQRVCSRHFYRRPIFVKLPVPIISFSFDDAPRTAFNIGGNIMLSYGAKATFFISLGILNFNSPSGEIASYDDLQQAVLDGHELGCHTYDHRDAWNTSTDTFIQAIIKNQKVLNDLFPELSFLTMSYPINDPRPFTKREVGRLFQCCRGGGQTFNSGIADLNLIKAYFIDVRNNRNVDETKKVIDTSVACGGWLIFVTHDVTERPSEYGCTIKHFMSIVTYAKNAGAILLPVSESLELIKKSN